MVLFHRPSVPLLSYQSPPLDYLVHPSRGSLINPPPVPHPTNPPKVNHFQGRHRLVPWVPFHKSSLHPPSAEQPPFVANTLVNDNLIWPKMPLATHWTAHCTPVTVIYIIPAGTSVVQTVDHVAIVDIGQSLGGDNLDVDAAGAAEMLLKIPLTSFTHVNVGNFLPSNFIRIRWVKFPLFVGQLGLCFY